MAAVTDEHVAALRAHLVGEHDKYERLRARFDSFEAQTGFNTLLAAAFIASVHCRFGRRRSSAEIAKFVAAARTRYEDGAADEMDPNAAERLIKVALGDVSFEEDLDDKAKALQVPLLNELIGDECLDSDRIEELLDEARKLADQWTS
jgi:hypothetical protein